MRSARATGGRGTRPGGARVRRRRGQRRRSPAAAGPAVNSRVAVQQAVADAADCLDQVRTPELLAQLCDVDVDSARSTGERESPHAVEEPVALHDVAGVTRKFCKQLELECPQCERRARECRATASKVNPQLAYLEDT